MPGAACNSLDTFVISRAWDVRRPSETCWFLSCYHGERRRIVALTAADRRSRRAQSLPTSVTAPYMADKPRDSCQRGHFDSSSRLAASSHDTRHPDATGGTRRRWSRSGLVASHMRENRAYQESVNRSNDEASRTSYRIALCKQSLRATIQRSTAGAMLRESKLGWPLTIIGADPAIKPFLEAGRGAGGVTEPMKNFPVVAP